MNAKRKTMTLLAATAMAMTVSMGAAVADHNEGAEVTPPAVAECEGTADVWTGSDPFDPNAPSPGLTFPGVDDARHFNFQLDTVCTGVDSETNIEGIALDARGTGTGWCGHSTAPADDETGLHNAGTNDGTFGAHHLDNIEWVSAGSVLEVTFTHDAGGLGQGSATVEAFGGDDCGTEHGSNTFEVVIVAEIH